MSAMFLLILIVGAVIFLAMLGKHGWNPVLKTVLVLAMVPLAYLLVGRASQEPATTFREPTKFVRSGPSGDAVSVVTTDRNGGVRIVTPAGQNGTVRGQTVRRNVLNPAPGWHEEFDQHGFFGWRPFEGQVRPVVRGRWSVLALLVFFGLATFVVLVLVRRGSWSWSGVGKAGALILGIGLVLIIGSRWTTSRVERQRAVEVATVARRQSTETPRIRSPEEPARAATGTEDATRNPSELYRDVEVWRRESVLGFTPYSEREEPEWCREGRNGEPVMVRTHDTEFLSSLPEGRHWLVGYSSQHPEIDVAEREALAEARRKLAVEALLQVKKRVPELDVAALEELAEHLADRYAHGVKEASYVEEATLKSRDGRPYGTVYRAAVRVGAYPGELDSLARRICRTVDYSRPGRWPDLQVAFFTGIILVVLAFSAFLVYVFFRAGTTGKWAFPLRAISSLMLAALAAAAIYVSVQLGAL